MSVLEFHGTGHMSIFFNKRILVLSSLFFIKKEEKAQDMVDYEIINTKIMKFENQKKKLDNRP